jgi:hypothetical protein
MKSCRFRQTGDDRMQAQMPAHKRYRGNADAWSLFVNMLHVGTFAEKILDRIEQPFTLVTGDSDLSAGPSNLPVDTLEQILNHPYLVQWFVQNCAYDHVKLHHMPIGMDYHSMSRKGGNGTWGGFLEPVRQEQILDAARFGAPNLQDKIPAAFCNWQHVLSRGDRLECITNISLDAIHLENPDTPRAQTWRNNAQYLFTVSPFGMGMDCHRTWEALLLGSIPIVRSSSIDPLFAGLPVCIVKNWSEVKGTYLERQRQRILESEFDFSRLFLAHWTDLINGHNCAPQPVQGFQNFIDTGLSDTC